MNYLAYHENKNRGSFDFPAEYHDVTPDHPRYQMPLHWHMEYELILVRKGHFSLLLDGVTYELSAGDAVLCAGGAMHGGTPHACAYECLVFDFHRFLSGGFGGHDTVGRELGHSLVIRPFFPAGESITAEIVALFDALKRGDAGTEWTVLGAFFKWIGCIISQKYYENGAENKADNKNIHAVKRVLRRIRSDYATPLTLADLAAEAGLSSKYFCRLFRQVTGRTPIAYLQYYRIECAAVRLLAADEPITEVAYACGFGDISYFTKAFRHAKGVSARDYRKANFRASLGN